MTSELARGAVRLIDGLVKESLEKIMLRRAKPIAITARFFQQRWLFRSETAKKSRNWANEFTVLAARRRLQGRFMGYDHSPFATGFARSAGGARIPGGRPRPECPSRIVEPNHLPARLIHEPTVRARCKRQPTRS